MKIRKVMMKKIKMRRRIRQPLEARPRKAKREVALLVPDLLSLS